MTAKEYLSQAYRLDYKIKSLTMELNELQEMKATIGSAGFDVNYNPNCPVQASFVKTIEKIKDMEDTIQNEIKKCLEIREEVRTIINKVENEDEQIILRERYIHFRSWDEIANIMNYGVRWIQNIHGRALLTVEKILKRGNHMR